MLKLLNFIELFKQTYNITNFVINDNFKDNFFVVIDGNVYIKPKKGLLNDEYKLYKNAIDKFLKTNNNSMTALEVKNHLRELYGFGITQKEVSEFLNKYYSDLNITFLTNKNGQTYKKYTNIVKSINPSSIPIDEAKPIKLDFDLVDCDLFQLNDGNHIPIATDSIKHTFCDELLIKNGKSNLYR